MSRSLQQRLLTGLANPRQIRRAPNGDLFFTETSAGQIKIIRGYKDGKPEELPIDAKPCRDRDVGGEDLINIKCDIHPWMSARALVFDHPYVAITKDDGTYEIKNAPEGAELEIVYWHEATGKPTAKKLTLKSGVPSCFKSRGRRFARSTMRRRTSSPASTGAIPLRRFSMTEAEPHERITSSPLCTGNTTGVSDNRFSHSSILARSKRNSPFMRKNGRGCSLSR